MRTLLPVPVLTLILLVGQAPAQTPYPPNRPAPPVVTLGAPMPDAPNVPFLGANYSLQSPRTPCRSFGYYAPGYVAPMFYNPRYPDPGPYFFTATYPYARSYYSYYYTPGFFRY
jgi:hypothetical protein